MRLSAFGVGQNPPVSSTFSVAHVSEHPVLVSSPVPQSPLESFSQKSPCQEHTYLLPSSTLLIGYLLGAAEDTFHSDQILKEPCNSSIQ